MLFHCEINAKRRVSASSFSCFFNFIFATWIRHLKIPLAKRLSVISLTNTPSDTGTPPVSIARNGASYHSHATPYTRATLPKLNIYEKTQVEMEDLSGLYLEARSVHEQLRVQGHWEGSLENSRGTVGTEEATKRDQLQQPSQLLSSYSKTDMPRCNACSDLDWTKFDDTGCTQATAEELDAAVQRGCPTCSLISKATTTFCSSLASRHSEIYGSKRIDRVDILLQDQAALCLRLHFQMPSGCLGNVLLDFFSPRSKPTTRRLSSFVLTKPRSLHISGA